MTIVYTSSCAGVAPDNLHGFFEGWRSPFSPEQHLRLLQNSDEVVLAVDEKSGNVVGFITAITDHVLSAYIPLLEVLPEYRGQGIGRELVRRILERLSKMRMVDLVCDPELQPFYEALGMRPYDAMIIRR